MMAYVPYPDGRIIFSGTDAAATALAGFSRDTAFDTRYMVGASTSYVGPVDTAGGSDAAPTMTNHNHADAGHTHTLTSNSGGPSTSNTSQAGSNVPLPPQTHTHDFGATTASSTYGYQDATITFTAANVTGPVALKMIILKPLDALQEVPDGGILFGVGATPPPEYLVADGTNGTDNLANPGLGGLYVIGADTSGDAGAASGASTHRHPVTGSHTHTAAAHDHGTTVASKGNTSPVNAKSGTANNAAWEHHDVPSTGTTMPTTAAASPSWSSIDNAEPEHTECVPWQNKSGSDQPIWPDSIIPFVGAYGTIPADWYLCDSTEHVGCPDLADRYVKGATTSGTKAGAATHTHEVGEHFHTASGTHTHTAGTVVWNGATQKAKGFGFPFVGWAGKTHTHSTWTFSAHTNVDLLSQDGAKTSAVTNSPKSRSVLWIVFKPVTTRILGNVLILGKTTVGGGT